ncbi:MAG: ATP-binding protein [Desulfuromonadales bacterium]|nr:ATP-binding protein [Desulfuromonadales bacterium]
MQIDDDITKIHGMYCERLLTQRIVQLSQTFPVTVVSGARQVGKTTLLRHLFPGYDYVVFDPSIDIEQARKEPDLFLQNHPPPVILDEIQYAPEVVAALKRAVDRTAARPGQYLLTGSQQWQVLKTLAESLAGRAAFVDLLGLSLQELAGVSSGWLNRWLQEPDAFLAGCRNADYSPLRLNRWLWRGSLPGLLTVPDGLVGDFWAGYHRTYVERDARLLGEISDWQEFGRFFGLVCALTAQEINYSQLGREIGMTPQTARRWLAVLEGTFQWFSLPAFAGNPLKRVSQRPKGYLLDTGLACYSARISSAATLASHPMYGALFESAMVQELFKQTAFLSVKPAFYHWRSTGGAEVDLVLERDDVLYPVEFKLTANPGRHDLSGLRAFRAAHEPRRVAMGALVCAVEKPRLLSDDVLAIPWNILN